MGEREGGRGGVRRARRGGGAARCAMVAAVVLVTTLVASAARAADTIDALMSEIEKRVLAGDIDGYLKCVDPSDGVFLMEQRHWAEDFTRRVPSKFEFRIAALKAEAVEGGEGKGGEGQGEDSKAAAPEVSAASLLKIDGDAAEAPIVMRWTFEKWSSEREVRWKARFVRGADGWLYAGEKWNRAEGPGVLVLYDDGLEEVAQQIAEVLPEVRAKVHPGFGFGPDSPLARRTQQVKLYTTMRHLQASIYLGYTDSLAGWNEPGEAIKLVTGRRAGKASLSVLLGHEYGHVATFELGPKANDMPWWTLEGVAELAAEQFANSHDGNDRTVRAWAADKKLVDWEKLADFHGEAVKYYAQVYGQGHHMLGFISERYGREKRIAWLTKMASGATIDQASVEVLGKPWADVDTEWRLSLVEAPAEAVH